MMRHLTRRDVVVVGATALVIAFIALVVYVSLNYKVVKVGQPTNPPVVESKVPDKQEKQEQSLSNAHHTAKTVVVRGTIIRQRQVRIEDHEASPVAAPTPVAPAPVNVRVDVTRQSDPVVREAQAVSSYPRWDPVAQAAQYPSYRRQDSPYSEPEPSRERGGISRRTKIAIGVGIGVGVAAIILARKHR